MALSLRAEQKSINSIYAGGDDVYVIPNYQRPYSWGKDVCYQLYSDITDAFIDKDDYFIGTIVMAKGLDEKKRPNVVDGQQRLITLWLFLKVLTLLHPDKKRLQRTLVVQSLLSDEDEPRIFSKVYEHKDQKNIENVLGYTLDNCRDRYNTFADSKGNIQISEECSRIEANTLYIYKWLSEFYSRNRGDRNFYTLVCVPEMCINEEGTSVKSEELKVKGIEFQETRIITNCPLIFSNTNRTN